MSSDPAISVDGLGKRYRIGAQIGSYRTLRELIATAALSPLRRALALFRGESVVATGETIWALRDVTFEVEAGEVVGIIGRNGAGKTTLLKMLSRITEPTEGNAVLRGRVASLLEVGTGFHPELSGRENIFLNGAILGMKRGEIRRRFDEIVAFAEVERFIDTQVKHYSSGMYLRLAFSVAAHLDPEILLVDEVLAVGDAAFQRRCLGKMGEVGGSGRTVLFVSHNMEAVERLCQRCLWIDEGRVRADGEPAKTITDYLSNSTVRAGTTYQPELRESSAVPAQLIEAILVDAKGEQTSSLLFREPFSVRMIWDHSRALPGGYYILRLFDERERLLFVVNTVDTPVLVRESGRFELSCRFDPNVLTPGDYTITLGCHIAPRQEVWVDQCMRISVSSAPYGEERFTVGIAPAFAPPVRWDYQTVAAASSYAAGRRQPQSASSSRTDT